MELGAAGSVVGPKLSKGCDIESRVRDAPPGLKLSPTQDGCTPFLCFPIVTPGFSGHVWVSQFNYRHFKKQKHSARAAVHNMFGVRKEARALNLNEIKAKRLQI